VITIGVLACTKRKLDRPAAARELYTGDRFRKGLVLLERAGCTRLVVLSALHGAVAGERVLAPYDRALQDLSAADRRAWAARANAQLRRLVPAGARVIALAIPKLYAPALQGIAHEPWFAGLSLFEANRALAVAVRAGVAA
jgi:hypothetical protein